MFSFVRKRLPGISDKVSFLAREGGTVVGNFTFHLDWPTGGPVPIQTVFLGVSVRVFLAFE